MALIPATPAEIRWGYSLSSRSGLSHFGQEECLKGVVIIVTRDWRIWVFRIQPFSGGGVIRI